MNKRIIPSVLVIILALASILPLSSCGARKSLELSGTIESTQIDSCSEVAGRVIKLEKDEGEKVKQGDVLAVLDSSMQELAVKQQEALVELKAARLEELKAGTRPQQLEQAQQAANTAELAVKNAHTGVETAQTTYDYWLDKYNDAKELYESSTISQNELQDSRYKLDTAKLQLDTAKKQLETAEAQLKSANAGLNLLKEGSTSQAIKAAEADLGQSQAALDLAKLLLSKYQVKAAADGTYIRRNVEIGSMVNAGTSIGSVSDLGDLWTSIYVQQKYLKDVSLNQEVLLKATALDGRTVKGRIVFISGEAEFTPKNTETDESKESTVFKVKIKLLDNIDLLKPGMTVDAVIPLEGR